MLKKQKRVLKHRPKLGVYVNGHDEFMDTTKLKALHPSKIVGIRHDSGSNDRTMTEAHLNALFANDCDANGWNRADSILWTVRQSPGRVQSEWDEIVIAYAAGARLFELGNEMFNHWWGNANPPWTFRQYRDWCLSLIQRIPKDATVIIGSLIEESGAGLTVAGLATGMTAVGTPGDMVSRHPYNILAADVAADFAAVSAITHKPVMGSESSTATVTAAAAAAYLASITALENLTLTYFDGPATDARGLLAQVGGTGPWVTPTAAYNNSASSIQL